MNKNKQKDIAFSNHCTRMNEVVLRRNDQLKNLTDEQYFSIIDKTSTKSYQMMDEQK